MFKKCNCCMRRYNNNDYQEFGDESGKYESVLRVKYCCKWCCGIGTILLLLIIIIIFSVILPSVAQSSMDNASLIQIDLSMNNPTNNSIELNATLQVVNAGMFSAELGQTSATLLYKNEKVGTFIQPKINIAGNTGVTFNLLTTININTINGKQLFQKMAKEILNGNDVSVSFKSSPKLQPKIMGIKFQSISVSMNKDLIIRGSKMENAYIKQFDIKNTTQNVTFGFATIEFSIGSALKIYGKNINMSLYDIYNNQLGYSIIPKMKLIPGYNKLIGNTYLVECNHCSNISKKNNDSLWHFVQNYYNSTNQYLNIMGPSQNLVISNSIRQNALLYGYGNWK